MGSRPKFRPNPKLNLTDQVREVLRCHHLAYRTEQTYAIGSGVSRIGIQKNTPEIYQTPTANHLGCKREYFPRRALHIFLECVGGVDIGSGNPVRLQTDALGRRKLWGYRKNSLMIKSPSLHK